MRGQARRGRARSTSDLDPTASAVRYRPRWYRSSGYSPVCWGTSDPYWTTPTTAGTTTARRHTMTTAAASATPDPAPPGALADRDLPAEPRRDGAVVRPDRPRAAPPRRARRRPALHARRRAGGRGRSRRQAGGRYLACPIEDDPAHALNRAWSTLQAAARSRSPTSSRSAARGRSWPARCFAAWLGVPLITLIRGNDFDAAVFCTRRRPILDDALARSRAGLRASRRTRSTRSPRCTRASRVRWIPNGIDRADWALAPSDRAQARAWRASPTDAAHARALRPAEGQEGRRLPARRAAALRRRRPLPPAARGLDGARHGGVAGRPRGRAGHTALPFLDRFELLPWYAACDWIAIPSFYDGLPNVLVEAAALGVPMVAVARRTGWPTCSTDGETAFLFEPGDEARARVGAAARRPARRGAARADGATPAARWPRTELDGELELARYVEALSRPAARASRAP